MNTVAALDSFVLAILALAVIGFALTKLPMRWPPSRRMQFAQRTEAVRQGLEALRASVALRQTAEPDEAERSALNAEIDYYLSKLPAGEDAAASLWRRPSTKQNSFNVYIASLDTLIRALDVRRAAVAGVRPRQPALPSGVQPFAAGGTPTGDSSRSDTAPAETGAGGSNYRDAAALDEITKKFYESWAFKGLSAALLAGVALGVGGAFLLGGESYRLSEQLQNSYEKGEKQIGEIRDQAQTTLSSEAQLVKNTNADLQKKADELQTKANQFQSDADRAMAGLKEEQDKFTEKLKTDTVDKVVGDLQKAIRERTGEISDRINTEEGDLQPKLDALTGRVTKLNTGTASLETGIAQQGDRLKTADETIAARLKQFDIDVAAATVGLKTDVTDKVVRDLRQDIEHKTGEISDSIKAEENGLQPKFQALEARVTGLDKTAATLETDLGTAHDRVEKLKPRLGPLEQNLSAADQVLARLQAADTAAAQSQTRAEEHAAAALQAQHEAVEARDHVATQLDAVANGITPQRAALDQVTAAVAVLRTSLQEASNSIAGVTGDAAKLREVAATLQSISGQLNTLSQSVTKLLAARLEERIAALETNKPPPPPVADTGGRTVDNLTPAERCAVQRQLTASGFDSGTVDGTFGPATNRAIQRWQHSAGVTENGRLELTQIDSLIGRRGVGIPPCPKLGR